MGKETMHVADLNILMVYHVASVSKMGLFLSITFLHI